ncbi:diaminohydroxyphosphoribosylaminopyrimidine deaminase / 5-amino-6-(5-phosphoribosylamino)uracil reductase [Alteribacillus persepolensis]|uniref:Riboflavin biosynthesis protein RibD n=1 Tax=Alteribacillus persepolensis TaxID=568899 RepID=A0A1G7ZN35_9BACI|nr:bifunctional diaminohydroxyphosphoribosylaminopyrimidine deaminase/5-amino-6-(5-phosphoribosylamino)uracil reductase RibD [Alteribacillus persepolensis]SDH10098.1 diaminohydroxyphosphoribosylaminopyrimidine deaminase / 5-amino-6-(5-phosphoribosylamino)uracil reductase [Alteribacillus persepolensis]
MIDKEHMRLALQMARQTKGQTSPNPVVGAVVVKNGRVCGFGAHLRAGEEHAEVHALNMAGDEADGATIYVTLEPCSHYGKTPPCADLIIEKNIKRAVIATEDPNPEVAGTGIQKLKDAGIEVSVGIEREAANWLNRYFFHYIRTNIPYVTLKTAASLDGKTATKTGESKWITGEQARDDGHILRHEHDAILVGVNTVLEDDPSLTARAYNGGIHPVRIILDHHLKTPVHANMLRDKKAPVWIICSPEAESSRRKQLEQAGAKLFPVSAAIDIHEVLQLLGSLKIQSLYVEGGASVHGSFLEAGAFQEVVSYLAPKLIGGHSAPSVIAGNGIRAMSDVSELEIVTLEQLGSDIKIVAVPKK